MTNRLLALLFALTFAIAGCGGDDDDGGGGDRSVDEAKQALVDSCHKGNEGDDADLKLCECTGDELQSKHGYDTADKFDEARKSVEDNDVPTEVQAAVTACQARLK